MIDEEAECTWVCVVGWSKGSEGSLCMEEVEELRKERRKGDKSEN